MPPIRRGHHQQSIACEDCGKQFKSHYILILHARYHRKEGNYIFQRHSGLPQPEEPEEDEENQGVLELADDPAAPIAVSSPPPPHVLGQMSPPHLPNPVVTTGGQQPRVIVSGMDDEEEDELEEEAGDQDDEEDQFTSARGDRETAAAAPAAASVVRPLGGGVLEDDDDNDEEDELPETDEELECEICDARFHQVLELLKHIRVHRYELTESNYQQYRRKIVTTYRPNDVHLDLRRMPGEAAGSGVAAVGAAVPGAEYECDYCGKRFPTASNLRRHVLVHTGERPHQCPFCGCRFGDRSYMLKHTRFVHNVELARVQKAKTRPRYSSSACFKCQICNRYFENGDLLAVHLEKYHSRPDDSAQTSGGGGGLRRPQQRAAGGEELLDDEEAEDEDDEYPEDEEVLEEEGDKEAGEPHHRAHRQAQQQSEETLFSCDQCDFISGDLGQLDAHLAEHQHQQAIQLPAGHGDDPKPRLTVTISDG